MLKFSATLFPVVLACSFLTVAIPVAAKDDATSSTAAGVKSPAKAGNAAGAMTAEDAEKTSADPKKYSKEAKKAEKETASSAPAPKLVGNKLCPVTSGEVGSMQEGSHVDYKGYRIGLCCDSCKKKFSASADLYLKKAQDEAAGAKQ